MQIYVHRNNQQLGPFTEAEIRAQLAAGAISLLDHVWWQGQANWIPLGQTPLAPPAIPGYAHSLPASTGEHTSGLAIASLVCSFICCILSIPAIILGHLALSDIKRNPRIQGKGLAIAGLIIGYIGLLFLIFYIGCVVLQAAMAPKLKDILNQLQQQAQQDSNDTTNSGTPVTP